MAWFDLFCPVCCAEVAHVVIPAEKRAPCPSCGVRLLLDTWVTPERGYVQLPHRQFTRRVPPPPKTRVRSHRSGDRLSVHLGGFLASVSKKIELSPAGCEVRTWRGRLGGTQLPLPAVAGFIVFQHLMKPSDTGTDFLWCNGLVFRKGELVDGHPMFAHSSREDAEHMTSVLNEHHARLRAQLDPFRG